MRYMWKYHCHVDIYILYSFLSCPQIQYKHLKHTQTLNNIIKALHAVLKFETS